MRRKLQEILCDAEMASAEEIQLVLDELDHFKARMNTLLESKKLNELYDYDPDEPWWNK